MTRGKRIGTEKAGESVLVGVRFPPPLLRALDRAVGVLEKERHGVGTSRGDAVRALVVEALTARGIKIASK